jgi:hypothetical protein
MSEDDKELTASLRDNHGNSRLTTNEMGGVQSKLETRCDLLPPLATLAVSHVLSYGAESHGEDNWHAISVKEHLNHAITHIYEFLADDQNPWRKTPRDENHLDHAACRMMMALEISLRGGAKAKEGVTQQEVTQMDAEKSRQEYFAEINNKPIRPDPIVIT